MLDVTDTGDGVQAIGNTYRWTWTRSDDQVVVRDSRGRLILSHRLQPLVHSTSPLRAGICRAHKLSGQALDVSYGGVNGDGRLNLRLRFRDSHLVLESVAYRSPKVEDVVALHYTAGVEGGEIRPNARSDMCLAPGACQSPERYLFATTELSGKKLSLGVSGMSTGDFHQQWALPAHFMACFSRTGVGDFSGAACWGLGALPDGNLMVSFLDGRFSLYVNVRSDLWGHHRGPGDIEFPYPLLTAFGEDWYGAVAAYLDALVEDGYVPARDLRSLPAPAGWPQYNTWGDQAARLCFATLFDESHLRQIYADFRASGLAARLFVIDDKWEAAYGAFRHDEQRFPHFEAFLEEVRRDGYEIGLWTAFVRCEDYRTLGLDEGCVLCTPDGAPYLHHDPGLGGRSWYFFDPLVPQTAQYLRERAREMMRRYRPRLVKLDFGYELPTPDVAGPHDPPFGGERLFQRLLDVFAGALKEADPEITLQYYCLSPLVARFLDQCSLDDLWLSRGDYHAGFRKRALLSTWCGRLGVVPYGSTGYDWRSASDIWFDSAVIGTPGCIAPLAGDEYGQRLTPKEAARFNGLCRLARQPASYEIELLDADLNDPQGPNVRSWARREDRGVVTVALRPGDGGMAVYHDLLEADCQVLVASLTAEGIDGSRRLAVVPFGSGRLRWAWPASRRLPQVRARLLGGRETEVVVRRRGRWLEIPLLEEATDGAPVECLELEW